MEPPLLLVPVLPLSSLLSNMLQNNHITAEDVIVGESLNLSYLVLDEHGKNTGIYILDGSVYRIKLFASAVIFHLNLLAFQCEDFVFYIINAHANLSHNKDSFTYIYIDVSQIFKILNIFVIFCGARE